MTGRMGVEYTLMANRYFLRKCGEKWQERMDLMSSENRQSFMRLFLMPKMGI